MLGAAAAVDGDVQVASAVQEGVEALSSTVSDENWMESCCEGSGALAVEYSLILYVVVLYRLASLERMSAEAKALSELWPG